MIAEEAPYPIEHARFTRAIVDAANDAGIGVVVSTARTTEPTIVFASERAASMLGREVEELVGESGFIGVPPEDLARIAPIVADAAQGEDRPLKFETALLRADGARVPTEVALSFVEHRDETLVVAFLTDVSVRRDAIAALESSRRGFSQLVEGAPEAVWILGRDGLLYANPAAVKLFGYDTLDEVLGSDPRTFAHPDEAATITSRARAMFQEGKQLPPHEYRVRRRDGAQLVLEVSSIVMEYEGKPAILSFGRDVTERKRIELALLKADRLAALGLLAGGMAHAINNPLSYVLLDLAHVSKRLPRLASEPDLIEDTVARLKEAYQGADRIARVVRRMRAFSRVDERARGSIDVRLVLDAALELVGHEIRHRGRLVTDYHEVPPVEASEAHLEQVFLHLLVHAAQALPEGESSEVRIEVRCGDDGFVVVAMTVVGQQMDRDELQRAFEPFYVSEADRGTKIGLPFCHAVVTSLGGTLVAESDQHATTFRMALPAGEPDPDAPASSTAQLFPEGAERRARILVVDDDPGIGSALRVALEEAHAVTCTTSALEARDMLLAGETFDVVFCDVMMPDLDGEKLHAAVREARPEQADRFVFMTAGVTRPTVAKFITGSGMRRLDKPFTTASVRDLVRRVVSDPR